MKVLISGSRTITDHAWIKRVLTDLRPTEVIHGGARGVDTLAEQAALIFKIPVRMFLADWDRHGRAAGVIRNREMLEVGQPDLVVAMWDGTSRGTANMIELAREAGVPLVVLEVKP